MSSTKTTPVPFLARRAFSLLEIILAIAIFAMAVASVGELVRLGLRNAQLARDTTHAQLLCESLMAELVAGAATIEPVVDRPSEIDPEWQYSINLGATETEGLLAVTVRVSRINSSLNVTSSQSTAIEPPEQFTLVRWLPDPQYVAELKAAAERQAAEAQAAAAATEGT